MLNQKQKLILLIFIPLLIFTGIILFLISPLFSEINDLRRKIQKEKLVLEEWQEKEKNFFFLEKDYKKVEKDKERVFSFLINASNIERFFEELENFSQKAGVDQEIYLLDKGKEVTDLKMNSLEEISLQIKIKGNSENLIKYFFLLKNFPYYLDFSSIKIDKSKEKEVISNLSLKSYILK